MVSSIVAPNPSRNQSPKSINITQPGPDIKVTETTIEGRTYLVWHEADRYWVRSVVSGKVADLSDLDSLNRFMTNLRRDLTARAARKAAATMCPAKKPQSVPQSVLQIVTFPYPMLPAPRSVPKIAGLLPAGPVAEVREVGKQPVILSSLRMDASKGIIYLPSKVGSTPTAGSTPNPETGGNPGSKGRWQYVRDPKKFTASKSGGGGFIWFGGEPRTWSWVMRNCNCAHCGTGLGKGKSAVRADGLIPNARYFTCRGSEKHVICSEDDLRWKIGAEARDQKHRAKGSAKDVKKAYPWLKAVPDSDPTEVVPF